jgi:uncharacterized membrane protein YkvI
MKLIPTLRNVGVALAVIPMLLLVIDSFLKKKIIDRQEFVTPFFIIVGVGIVLAIIAQKNMPKKDGYKFEQSE